MKLSNLIKIISGGTPKTSVQEYWLGPIPWISIKDFSNSARYIYSTEKSISKAGLDNSSTNILHHNDIIISARGTVGQIALIHHDMAFNQSCYGIRSCNEDLNQIYLYYWLIANKKYFQSRTHGSVFDTITRDDFDKVAIDIPSQVIQQHIVDTIINSNTSILLHNIQYNLYTYSISSFKTFITLSSNFLPSSISLTSSSAFFLSSSCNSSGLNLSDSSTPTYLPGFKL